MKYWLLLADPKSYSFDDLLKEKKALWDGIAGSLAQKNLRQAAKGDTALIYHTAPDKAVAGTAKISSDPYPDPKAADGKRVVVDIEPLQRLRQVVPLAELRRNKQLEGMAFLRIQRIAVSAVTEGEFREILRMSQE